MQEQDGRLPESGSMSKIYHLRKAPGSTPELSLVSSAESVAKAQNEGTQKDTLSHETNAFLPDQEERVVLQAELQQAGHAASM